MKRGIDTSAELAELRKIPANKRCFDCSQAGTTYAVPELGIFLCSICGGIHREFNHRVKGLSTCNFSEAEVSKLKNMGNEKAAFSWMGRHDPRVFPIPDLKDANKLKDFLRLKYLDKRFYENKEIPVPVPVQIQPEPPKPVEKRLEKAQTSSFINLLDDDPAPVHKQHKTASDIPSGVNQGLGIQNSGNYFATNFPPPSNPGINMFPQPSSQFPPSSSLPQYPQPNNPQSYPPANNPQSYPQASNPQTYPPANNPQSYPPANNPQSYPPANNPQSYPQGNNPQSYPQGNNPQSYPPANNPQSYPPANNPQSYPQGNNPQSYPPANNPQSYPQGNNPQSYPQGNNPQSYPQGNNSQAYPPASNPQSYPPANNSQSYPSANNPQNYPQASNPQNYPPANNPQNYSQNYPPSSNPQSYPQTSNPQNYPPTSNPQSYPPSNPTNQFRSVSPTPQYTPSNPPPHFPVSNSSPNLFPASSNRSTTPNRIPQYPQSNPNPNPQSNPQPYGQKIQNRPVSPVLNTSGNSGGFQPFVSAPSYPAPSSNFPPNTQNFPPAPNNNYPPSYNFPQNYPSAAAPNPPPGPTSSYNQYPQGYNYPQGPSLSPPIVNPSNQAFFSKPIDPFEQIFEEEREKKLIAKQKQAHITPAQNLMIQQYTVQAQMYQKTYGVQYPYTFQQWVALNNPPAPQENRPHSKNPFDMFA